MDEFDNTEYPSGDGIKRKLIRLLGMCGIVLLVIVSFFVGSFKVKYFEPEQVDIARVCNYCTGDRWPKLLEVTPSELKVTCGEDDNVRVGLLGR